MVSNAIDMELAELLKALKRIKRQYAADPEYRKLRAALPKEWPI